MITLLDLIPSRCLHGHYQVGERVAGVMRDLIHGAHPLSERSLPVRI
jgi:hypothetical protein